MAVIDRVAPYVEQLLENQDVQADLQRAAARARQAYGGAKGKKSKKKALSDNRVRRRLRQSVAAGRDAVLGVKHGREQEENKARRRRRGRLLLVLAFIAGGAVLTLNEDVRRRLLGLLRGVADSSGESVEYSGTTGPAPAPGDRDK